MSDRDTWETDKDFLAAANALLGRLGYDYTAEDFGRVQVFNLPAAYQIWLAAKESEEEPS